VFASQQMPVVLGRSPQATFCVDDSRVSRSHAPGRLAQRQLPAHRPQLQRHLRALQRRRDRQPAARQLHLHGSGTVGLGGTPNRPRLGLRELSTCCALPTHSPKYRWNCADTMRVLYVDDDRVNSLLFEETCRYAEGVEVRPPTLAPKPWNWWPAGSPTSW
jgi:hypothetical protein